MPEMPFMPQQASTVAARIDALYLFLMAISAFFGLLIAGVVVYFFIRYRRRSEEERPPHIEGSFILELTWSLVPLGIVMVVFFWSTKVFFEVNRTPPNAMEIYVVGKRWMWKVQHMTGQREINELHVPLGVPVKLMLTSEDVIHSFYVPDFRVKRDAIPGRYSTIWFQATKAGPHHLFCAEYCGTRHSAMIGWVHVMEPHDFQNWLGGGGATEAPAVAGEKLFKDLSCITCHRGDSGARGPDLKGVFGSQVQLADGSSVTADESYVRESIVNPTAKVAAGYQPVMPTFQGVVSEEQLMQLVAYVQSLKSESRNPPAPSAVDSAPPAAPGTRQP